MPNTVSRTGPEEAPVRSFVGCDSHRKYSVFVAMDEQGRTTAPLRVGHEQREFRNFLRHIPAGTPVAVEATGSWYWLVDAIEAAGLIPHLAQPFAAKRMTGVGGKKTDSVDARCLATLLRNGTLPETWIPDSANRDLRHLMRTRLALREYQTGIKNRIVAAINAYGLRDPEEDCDLFRGKGRLKLALYKSSLPKHTQEAVIQQWSLVDDLEKQIQGLERYLKNELKPVPESQRLKSLPGVGAVLGATIYLEVGAVTRFASAQQLACYSGLVPVVHASGGRTFYGPTSKRSNSYLRWAFVEAANLAAARRKVYPQRHVSRLYERLRPSKGHQKAAVAVARHLAESAWWILTKQQDYREPPPAVAAVSSSENG